MKKTKCALSAIVLAGMAFAQTVCADLLVEYDFNTDLGASTQLDGVAGTDMINSNLLTFEITDSIEEYATTVLQVKPRNGSTTVTDSIDNNSFFEFTVSASDADTSLDLSTLTFLGAAGGTGTRGYSVVTVIDGVSTTVQSADFATVRVFEEITVDLSDVIYDDLSSITFQIYAYTPTQGKSVEFDDIQLNGSVVPEPATMGMVGLGGIALFFIRRMKK